MYQNLFKLVLKKFVLDTKQKNQQRTLEIWNKMKDSANFKQLYDAKVQKLKLIQPKGTLEEFFMRNPPTDKSGKNAVVPSTSSKSSNIVESVAQTPSVESDTTDGDSSEPSKPYSPLLPADRPRQKLLSDELNLINAELVPLLLRHATNNLSDESQKLLKNLQRQKEKIELKLRRLESDRVRHSLLRQERKRKIDDNPELAQLLNVRQKKGRPALTDNQPTLLQVISELAMHGSSAQEKRRFDVLRTIKTLDDLTQELNNVGFVISRSATYYHLMPKNQKTIDGKRHVTTAPVRLIRATNDLHKAHEDSEFAKSTINSLFELASMLGPTAVAMISQDDKARVPIGITAANTQAPLLMHMEYRVRLPDHDWVVAEKHKLIPSVYAHLEIKSAGYGNLKAVSYSGKQAICIKTLLTIRLNYKFFIVFFWLQG
jgi:hypothetical protein